MARYCEVSDVARELGVTDITTIQSTLTDDVVGEFIEDASEDVDDWTGRDWGSTTVNQELHDMIQVGPMAGKVRTNYNPIIKIHKLEYWNGSEWKSDTEEAPRAGGSSPSVWTYSLYKDSGLIVFHALTTWGYNVVRVTYTWGFDMPPRTVSRAAACLAAVYCLTSISDKAQAYFAENGVQTRYAGGWEYGMQLILIRDKCNQRLSRLREFLVST